MSTRDPGRLVDVVVVVPARDESARIATCLRSVRISLHRAVSAGAVGNVAVAVVGHRCTDDTLGRADRVLVGLPHVLVADGTSTTVGDVRALGVRAALDLLPVRVGRLGRLGHGSRSRGSSRSSAGRAARAVWILNTDADSVVPATWVTDVLAHSRGGHQAVVGMARLTRPVEPDCPALQSNPAAALAYRRIIRAGIHGASHDHVYGANLAVRADAYASVLGFPSVPVARIVDWWTRWSVMACWSPALVASWSRPAGGATVGRPGGWPPCWTPSTGHTRRQPITTEMEWPGVCAACMRCSRGRWWTGWTRKCCKADRSRAGCARTRVRGRSRRPGAH